MLGDGNLWAMADPLMLEQAIGHLVQNAVDASTPGQPVTVRMGGRQQVTITVADCRRMDKTLHPPVPAVRLDQEGRVRGRRVRGQEPGLGHGRPADRREQARRRQHFLHLLPAAKPAE